MNPMQVFLKGGHFREVRITDHAHGNRVTLWEHFSEVSFGVSDDIPMAFDDALKNFEPCLNRQREEELAKLQREKEQTEIDLKNLIDKIKKAKLEKV